MEKVKECQRCGQGFREDNTEVGGRISMALCMGGHEGPFPRIAPAGNKCS